MHWFSENAFWRNFIDKWIEIGDISSFPIHEFMQHSPTHAMYTIEKWIKSGQWFIIVNFFFRSVLSSEYSDSNTQFPFFVYSCFIVRMKDTFNIQFYKVCIRAQFYLHTYAFSIPNGIFIRRKKFPNDNATFCIEYGNLVDEPELQSKWNGNKIEMGERKTKKKEKSDSRVARTGAMEILYKWRKTLYINSTIKLKIAPNCMLCALAQVRHIMDFVCECEWIDFNSS